MSFKLSESVLNSLRKFYGKDIESLNGATWYIALYCCSCSGDYGSNWLRNNTLY